jgi:hypothetical protein
MAHHHLYYAGQTEPLSLVEVAGNRSAILLLGAVDLALLARVAVVMHITVHTSSLCSNTSAIHFPQMQSECVLYIPGQHCWHIHPEVLVNLPLAQYT